MRKTLQTQFFPFIFFILSIYLAYYLLILDQKSRVSICHIIQVAHTLSIKPHLLVLGILPIYISLMIFGAGLLGLFLGCMAQHLVVEVWHNK